jgi:Mor family transcriptional regulator
MEINFWIGQVRPEDIPEKFKEWVDAVGVEGVLKIAELIGGTTFYMPKVKCFIPEARDRLIIEAFKKGERIPDIAIKFGLTDVWVRKLISKNELKENQLELFLDGGCFEQ